MRVAVILVVGACRFSARDVPDDAALGEAGLEVDAPAIDAPLDAAAKQLCGGFPPRIDEDFTTPCTGWGESYVNGTATLATANGLLRITPVGVPSGAGCDELQLHPWTSALLELKRPLAGADNYTVFQALGRDRSLGVVNDALVFSNGDGSVVYKFIAYEPAEMRWLRMRATPTLVIAEYSPDAESWQQLAEVATQSGTMRINVIAGVDPGATVGGVAEIERLVVCP